jgi:hypothetical protein
LISSPPFCEVCRLPHHSPDHGRVLKSLVWVFSFLFLSQALMGISDEHAVCGTSGTKRSPAPVQDITALMSGKTVAVEAYGERSYDSCGPWDGKQTQVLLTCMFQASSTSHLVASCAAATEPRPASQHLHWTDGLVAVCAHLHSDDLSDEALDQGPSCLSRSRGGGGQFHRADAFACGHATLGMGARVNNREHF